MSTLLERCQKDSTLFLSNTSNEKIDGKFLIKIETKNCNQILTINSENSNLIERYSLNNSDVYEIVRSLKLKSHGHDFIYYNVQIANNNCLDKVIHQNFPISIISWSVRN